MFLNLLYRAQLVSFTLATTTEQPITTNVIVNIHSSRLILMLAMLKTQNNTPPITASTINTGNAIDTMLDTNKYETHKTSMTILKTQKTKKDKI